MKTFLAIKPGEKKDSFLTPENMALLRSFGEVREAEGEFTVENICKAIGDADVYMTCWGSPRLDEEILKHAPNLKLLAHLCGTVVPFVSEAQWNRGIRVISGNNYFAESTAEGAVAYIFAAQREILHYGYDLTVKKQWARSNSYTRSLLGKTVGVVSYGAVAKNVVRMISPFRVKTLVYDIVPIPEEDKKKYGIEQVSLEELFSRSDIITVHTPLNDATKHMIGADLLERIKPDALLVNASRGAIIDQRALEKILATGKFRAALDVYEEEPPKADCALFDIPGLLMMPHMGGPTVDLRPDIAFHIINDCHGFIDEGKELQNEIKRSIADAMSRK